MTRLAALSPGSAEMREAGTCLLTPVLAALRVAVRAAEADVEVEAPATPAKAGVLGVGAVAAVCTPAVRQGEHAELLDEVAAERTVV